LHGFGINTSTVEHQSEIKWYWMFFSPDFVGLNFVFDLLQMQVALILYFGCSVIVFITTRGNSKQGKAPKNKFS
jgi:hypothetical protein